MVVPPRSVIETETPLESLLELTRSAGEDSLPEILAAVAETIRGVAGFNTVVINLYRPAWDDYEVVLVLGCEASRAALQGTTAPSESWNRLFSSEQQSLPGVFFLDETSTFWEDVEDVFVPDIPRTEDPDAWQPDDGLIVFLRESNGTPLGFLSVDEPASGRRPTSDDLRLTRAICSHAEQALCSAKRSARATENARMLSQLLGASPALSACATTQVLLETACDMVVPQLGFHRIAAFGLRDPDTLELAATRGWSSSDALAPTLSVERTEPRLRADREHAGCWLMTAAQLFGPAADPFAVRSGKNGRGLAAWSDHCLVVPCRGDTGRLRGLIVIEDPSDRLLPTDERRRAVRLLIEQVSAAQNTIEHREQLSHLASHDPLTGVRNRRGLTDLLREHADAALLVCDLDHFKHVNDRYGHEVGDRVLARFGALLRELSRAHDVPMRLGGEEFCLILPDTDRLGALQAAERLRAETTRRMRDLIPEPITVSIGVATNADGTLDAYRLLSDADRGLYAAKQAGRDRTVEAR
ncbi:MAG TPA: sensor domain-containing diguanylate cyclase [Solirubrobacteraceae bacterium]|jgi:diguanylate cyclase (GGDEF)-like protein